VKTLCSTQLHSLEYLQSHNDSINEITASSVSYRSYISNQSLCPSPHVTAVSSTIAFARTLTQVLCPVSVSSPSLSPSRQLARKLLPLMLSLGTQPKLIFVHSMSSGNQLYCVIHQQFILGFSSVLPSAPYIIFQFRHRTNLYLLIAFPTCAWISYFLYKFKNSYVERNFVFLLF